MKRFAILPSLALLGAVSLASLSVKPAISAEKKGAFFAWKKATHFGFYNPNNPNPSGIKDIISYCSFTTPGALQMYTVSMRNKADNVGQLTNSQVSPLQFVGACPKPSGYFAWNKATHYSIGDGKYCSFPTAEGFAAHNRLRPDALSFGQLPSDPTKFMVFTGACGR